MLIDLGACFGGVERYVVHLTHLLKTEAEIYALCVLPELAQRLQAAGARVVLLPVFRGPLKPLRFILAMALLPFLLLRHRIQVVQVNGFLESILMLPARLMGCRTVYTRHGSFELKLYRWYRDPLRFVPRALARLSVHLATEVICVSEAVGIEVRAIRPRVPFTVIPNWLTGQPPAQPVRPASESGLRLICVSRLEQYKGIHLAIEAMRGLAGVRLTVVGDGPCRFELERLAAGQPVEFSGFQADMQPHYQAADIFLMPSIGPEGLPMSSLEAMGRGLPCIFSDLPVHREISDDGRGAILFQSGNADSLRSAVQTLVADVELRLTIATAAYRIVQERYTERSVQTAYVRVFNGR